MRRWPRGSEFGGMGPKYFFQFFKFFAHARMSDARNYFSYQVSLELSEIDVEGAIESERGGDRRNDLTNQTVQVCVGWALDVQVSAADIIDSLNLI